LTALLLEGGKFQDQEKDFCAALRNDFKDTIYLVLLNTSFQTYGANLMRHFNASFRRT